MMMRRRGTVIFLLAVLTLSLCAAGDCLKTPPSAYGSYLPFTGEARATQWRAVNVNDVKSRNIYALFMRVNPRLSSSDAKKYIEIIFDACAKFKQDPYVIAGIIVHESTVNSKAVSKGGDYGLMQVRWKVHTKAIKQRFPKVKHGKDILDARTNIFFGTEIFSDCMKKSNGDVSKGLLRYSAGNTKLRDKVLATVKELQRKGR